MITKSYEIEKNPTKFSNFNLFLLYGENFGLKKDIKESIKLEVTKKDGNPEFLNLYENEVVSDPENFYNSFFSGSLFSTKKIITIHNATDKILKIIVTASNSILSKSLNSLPLFLAKAKTGKCHK